MQHQPIVCYRDVIPYYTVLSVLLLLVNFNKDLKGDELYGESEIKRGWPHAVVSLVFLLSRVEDGTKSTWRQKLSTGLKTSRRLQHRGKKSKNKKISLFSTGGQRGGGF